MTKNKLYIDCPSGIAGDMFIAACIDLGVSINYLQTELKKLKIDKFSIAAKTVDKKGITAKHLEVTIEKNNHENHHHDENHHHERHLSDINKLIDESSLSTGVKMLCQKIFHKLASAEAFVHNTTIDKVHFHEIGAMDSIIDIIGAAICLQQLGIDEVHCSEIPIPAGKIICDHGEISNPAPATLKLLEGFETYKVDIKKEIITPT
ncbi:LarC family nickel insertion protein [Candidatus Woesearchaeota archaeon]|nr:LarC family nickel insertion protein [Candidatus Woesearchaeota archaeon]